MCVLCFISMQVVNPKLTQPNRTGRVVIILKYKINTTRTTHYDNDNTFIQYSFNIHDMASDTTIHQVVHVIITH
jgi:hypothetical protein